jgi:transposase
MRMRDELGVIFEEDQFVGLFPKRGKPAFSPCRLALATIMQFSEDLSDRQAADAVRGRIDWKYALSLELDDPGFDASILCEFRTRLLENGDERLLFDALLERFRAMRLAKARGRQRTDSTHVLAAARNLERLELVGEAMRRALNAMAVAAPGWLRTRARPEWALRYARPFDDRWLPKGKEERREEAEQCSPRLTKSTVEPLYKLPVAPNRFEAKSSEPPQGTYQGQICNPATISGMAGLVSKRVSPRETSVENSVRMPCQASGLLLGGMLPIMMSVCWAISL